jgi:hypothetical protein
LLDGQAAVALLGPRLARRIVVYAGTERVTMPNRVEAVSLYDLATELASTPVWPDTAQAIP